MSQIYINLSKGLRWALRLSLRTMQNSLPHKSVGTPSHAHARASTHIHILSLSLFSLSLVHGHTLFQPCSQHPLDCFPLLFSEAYSHPQAFSSNLNLTHFPHWEWKKHRCVCCQQHVRP